MLTSMVLAAAIGASPMQATEPQPNRDGWIEIEETSNLDGSRSYLAIKDATDDARTAAGLAKEPTLGVSCSNGNLRIILSWPTFLGLDEVWVDASADRGQVHKWTFMVPTQGRIAAFEGSGNWRRFSNATAGRKTMTFRVHAYADTQEATFELAGLSEVMSTALEVCGA